VQEAPENEFFCLQRARERRRTRGLSSTWPTAAKGPSRTVNRASSFPERRFPLFFARARRWPQCSPPPPRGQTANVCLRVAAAQGSPAARVRRMEGERGPPRSPLPLWRGEKAERERVYLVFFPSGRLPRKKRRRQEPPPPPQPLPRDVAEKKRMGKVTEISAKHDNAAWGIA